MYLNLRTVLTSINFRIAVFPLLLALVIAILAGIELYTPSKYVLETLAIVILGAFLILFAVYYMQYRAFIVLWGAGIVAVLLAREIHFYGTEYGVYGLLLVMLLVALRNFDRLKDYLLCPSVSSSLFAGFLLYFIAISVDQRWWFWVPGEEIFHLPLEETLELFGHLLVGGSLLAAPALAGKADRSV